MQDSKSLLAECESCHEKLSISSADGTLVSKKEYDVNGQSVYLTYYDCQKCGKRHFVQADDDKSLEMLEVNKKQFVHNAALRVTGKKLRKKKIDQYKDSKRHLCVYRKNLMEKLEGARVYDIETGQDFVVRFSV